MALHFDNPLDVPKAQSYYDNLRKDIIAAIEQDHLSAQRVLELGCAGGTTSKELKRLLGSDWYVGVELSVEAAEKARGVLDEVHVANVETTAPAELGLKENDFDLLLTIDVLEHLRDPWETLARWARLVRPGGLVLMSLPNTQNIGVVSRLVMGDWHYEKEGLLDATHLRFFTEKSMKTLVAGAGLEIVRLRGVPGPKLDISKVKESGNGVRFAGITLSGLSRQQMTLLYVFQFVVIARRLPEE